MKLYRSKVLRNAIGREVRVGDEHFVLADY